jgi:hypothetical protein|nr:hypothetical protein [Kofleriaceae bacterium]
MRFAWLSVVVVAACGSDPAPAVPGAPADVQARVTADLGHVLGAATTAERGSLALAPGGHALAMLGVQAPAMAAVSPADVTAQLNRDVFAADAGSDGVYSLAGLGVDGTVEVTIDGDTTRFHVATAQLSVPVDVELTHDSLAATVGAATARLDVIADDHVTASLGFADPLDVAIGGVRVRSAPAASALVADLDASASRATAQLALGATTVTSGDSELVLPGATGDLDVEPTGLVLADAGLGDATTLVTRAGSPVVAIDVNPRANRRADLDIAPTTHAVESVATPELAVQLTWFDAPPAAALTELYVTGLVQVTLDTAAVLTGELVLATVSPALGVDATAGDCVSRVAAGGWTMQPCD